jgi:hypothetical protein
MARNISKTKKVMILNQTILQLINFSYKNQQTRESEIHFMGKIIKQREMILHFFS